MTPAKYQAPAELETVRSFINSVRLEERVDPLQGPDELAEWCSRSSLCANAPPADLSRLRGFREALRTVLENSAGTREHASAWRALEPFAQGASYGMRIDAAGVPALEPAGEGADRAIATLLGIVHDAMRRGIWSRLKVCRKDSCRWAYYDHSKNGSGVWCDMRWCGNRMKAKRRRDRGKNVP